MGARSEKALDQIEDLLRSDLYTPGRRLPSEETLCEQLGVSRTTLRRALACLVDEGRLVSKRGLGTFVADNPAEPTNQVVGVMGFLEPGELVPLQNRALDAGFLLNVYSQNEASWNPRQERQFLNCLLEHPPVGLLAFLSPTAPRNDDVLVELAKHKTRIVQVGLSAPQLPDLGFMVCDYVTAGRMAAVALLMAGCRKPVIVSMPRVPCEKLMQEGFEAALRDHGKMEPEQQWVDGSRMDQPPPGDGVFLCRDHYLTKWRKLGLLDHIPPERRVTFWFNGLSASHETQVLGYPRMEDFMDGLGAIIAAKWHAPRRLRQPVLYEVSSEN